MTLTMHALPSDRRTLCCCYRCTRIVIHSGEDGVIDRARLQAQVSVLNEAYAGCTDVLGVDTKMRFTMQGAAFAPVYRDNAQWYSGCGDFGAIDDAILTEFVKHDTWDGVRVVYMIVCNPTGGLLGYSTIPDLNG